MPAPVSSACAARKMHFSRAVACTPSRRRIGLAARKAHLHDCPVGLSDAIARLREPVVALERSGRAAAVCASLSMLTRKQRALPRRSRDAHVDVCAKHVLRESA